MANNEARIEINAVDKTAQAFDSVKAKMSSLNGAAGLLSSTVMGLTGALSVGVFSSMIKDAANAADALNDVAKANEVAVGSVIKLSESLTLNGGNANDASKVFSSLTNKLDEAATGSEKAQAQFARVGVTLQDLKTLDGQQLFEKTLAGLAQIEDPITRNATAMELFGKAVKGVDLKGLADDYAANQKNFDETERAFKEIGKAMDNIDKAQAALKMSLATNVAPWYAASLNYLADLIGGYDQLEKNMAKVRNGNAPAFKAAPKITDTPEFGAFNLPKEYQGGERREVVEGGTKKPKATVKKESGKSEAEKYAEDMQKLLKTFSEANQPAQTLSEKLQAQYESYSKLDPAVRSYLQGVIQQTQATEAAAKAADDLAESNQRIAEMMEATQSYDDGAQAVYDANAESYNAILRETEDINIQLIENDRARAKAQLEIEKERALARIDLMEGEEEQINAIREATIQKFEAQQKTLESKTKNNTNIGKDLGLTFKSAFEDAVISGKKFGDVLDSLAQDIEKMLLRRTVTEPLDNAVSGFLKDFDFGSLLSMNANGNAYQSASLSQYSGSVVNKPTMFAFASGAGIMGEAGAEGIFPLKRGKDGKLGVSAEGSGKANVTVNLIESPGNGGQVNQSQNGNNITLDIMVEKIEGMIGRNINQGRGLAPVMERQYGLNRAAGAY